MLSRAPSSRAVGAGATHASAGILAPYIEGHERGPLFSLALRSLTIVDDLTKLYNRRGFLTLAERHLKLAVRKKSGVYLLFADVDDWQRAGSLAYLTTSPGGTHDAEWRFKRRDGSSFRCRTRGRRIDVGDEIQEWIWSFEDVTAEREADLRVQRALAEQELILDNATVGIAFVRNRAYQRCNPRFEQMFGYGPGELAGEALELLLPEELRAAHAAHRAGYTAAPHARAMGLGLELVGRRKDGASFPIEASISPLEGERDGVTIAFVVSVSDAAQRRCRKVLAHL